MDGYEVILADPPWKFRVRSRKGLSRSAENHYRTMPLDEIRALPVGSIAARDSVLFLWATSPCLEEALSVMSAWGFRYKTVGFCWVKLRPRCGGLFWCAQDLFAGLGYYTRSGMEVCLVGTRGKGLPRTSKGVRQVVMTPRGAHSVKPAEVRYRIEALYGERRRVELFARSRIPGWDAIGDAVDGRDIREVLGGEVASD